MLHFETSIAIALLLFLARSTRVIWTSDLIYSKMLQNRYQGDSKKQVNLFERNR